jgi:hypothetical protein
MRRSSFFTLVLLIMVAGFFTHCATSKVKIPNYIGTWDYEIDTPQGAQSGWMVFTQEEGELKGSINSDMGSIDLEDLVIEDNKLSATFFAFEMDMNLTGEFVEDVFNGMFLVQGYELPFTAHKKPQE